MNKNMNRKTIKEFAIIGAVLFILIACFFYDVFFFNKTLKSSITIAQSLNTGPYGQDKNKPAYMSYADNVAGILEEPYLEFKKHTFSNGIFPLWNPYQACGMPAFASSQFSALFPLEIFLHILPEKYGWDFYIILRIFLAGLFTYYLMRILGYAKLASLTAGAAYMFSGPIITWMVNGTTSVNIMIPLLLICVEKIIRKHNIKWIVISSFVIGTLILSGHIEYVFFALLTAAFYFLFRIFFINGADKIKIIKTISVSLILGLLLSCVFIFPFIEYMSFNGWNTHTDKTGIISEENPANAITILMPYFFQKVLLTNQYQRAGWIGGYIGLMTILFALIGMFSKNKNKNNIIFVFIALFVILKCYGVWIVNWIGYLPIFNKIRYSWNYTPNFAFAMAVLAGIGINRLIEAKKKFLKILLPGAVILIIILGHLFYYGFAPDKLEASKYAFILLALVILLAWVLNSKRILPVLLGLIMVIELFYLMPKEHAKKYDAFADVPYIEFIKNQEPRMRTFGVLWTLFPDTATGYGVDDLGVLEGVFVRRFVTYVNTFLSPDNFKANSWQALRTYLPNYNSPFLDLLNVGYIAAPSWAKDKIGLDPNTTELVYSGEADVYKRNTAFPRTFVVHKALFAKDQPGVIRLMKDNINELKDKVIIEGEDDAKIKDALELTPATAASKVVIKKYAPNHVEIEANLEYPGFVILADTYYPGWKVTVDGMSSRLFPAYLMLRAVFVEKGLHIINFSYRPITFILGAIISLLTVIGLITLLIYKRWNLKNR